MLNREIARLVSYGIVTGLIPEEERIYSWICTMRILMRSRKRKV